MQAVICNADHPEWGVATIPFPIPDEEYKHCVEMLKLLEIGGVTARDCYVDQIAGAPPVLDMLEGGMINVDELDFLARSIDRYTDEELAKFQCTAAARGYTDMTDLINLSFCCERTTVITDFSDLEGAGKSHYLTINGGCASVEEMRQLNGEGVARSLIASGEGKITPYGVVFENGMRLEPLYTGHSFPPYLDRPYLMELELETPQDEAPAVLFLSVPDLRLERLLERAGIRNYEDLIVDSWHSDLPEVVLERLDCPREGLYELNRLCAAVEKLDAAQVKKLSAVVLYAEPEYAIQIRHLAENLDQFEFVPDIKTPEEYGRHMIEESGHFEYDPNLDEYYDFEKYGRDRIASQDGQFNALGYVSYHGTLSLDELMIEDPAEQSQGMQMGGMA